MNLSIVIPIYNSSKILDTLMNSLHSNLFVKCTFLEVILVNDFSKDDSWEIIKKLKKKYNYIKGINLKKNYGQHSAIFCGLKFCVGDNVVCMDDDMQHDPRHISRMVDQLNSNEVCYVQYEKREHNFLKVLISKLNNFISSYLMNKPSKIYTSSFKCFKKNICDQIISNDETFVFLDYWIFKYAKKITYISVTHNKRLIGQTNYGLRQLLTLWSKMLFIIEVEKNSLRSYLLLFIQFFFKIFLRNYIDYKKDKKIQILEKL